MRAFLLIGLVYGCQPDKDDEEDDASCDLLTNSPCLAGLVCEAVEGGDPACFQPVSIEGRVFDLVDDAPVADARVVAMDVNGAPQSTVAISAADGGYHLDVPTLRTEDGDMAGELLTLRADAAGYQPFPSGLRLALPVDVREGLDREGAWVLQTTATDIGLLSMPEGTGTGVIAGTAEVPGEAGVLVIASSGGSGTTGVADRDGSYAIFNLAAGTHDVEAFAAGVNYAPETASVVAGAITGVDLAILDHDTATLSGTVQIVNAPGGSTTSVILVAESTFDAALARGEMPPGLRATDVTGTYTIDGIPRGDWVVLAAFENDGLVRDPDPSIGGTQIQHVSVTADETITVEGFKVTEALAVLTPGAAGEERVGDTPTISWADDSSEDDYTLRVYDAFGSLVWETTVDRATGDDPAVPYAGPALEVGMYYQFRVTSNKEGAPISATEDLRGVFYR